MSFSTFHLLLSTSFPATTFLGAILIRAINQLSGCESLCCCLLLQLLLLLLLLLLQLFICHLIYFLFSFIWELPPRWPLGVCVQCAVCCILKAIALVLTWPWFYFTAVCYLLLYRSFLDLLFQLETSWPPPPPSHEWKTLKIFWSTLWVVVDVHYHQKNDIVCRRLLPKLFASFDFGFG